MFRIGDSFEEFASIADPHEEYTVQYLSALWRRMCNDWHSHNRIKFEPLVETVSGTFVRRVKP